MLRNRQINRTTLYVVIAIGILFVGLLAYGLAAAVTQASLALVAGLMLLIGNAPELIRTAQRREIGLAMLNTLVAVALLSFFLVKWFGFLFYVPLVIALVLALPLTLNRVAIVRSYLGAVKVMLGQLRRLVRIPNSFTQR